MRLDTATVEIKELGFKLGHTERWTSLKLDGVDIAIRLEHVSATGWSQLRCCESCGIEGCEDGWFVDIRSLGDTLAFFPPPLDSPDEF